VVIYLAAVLAGWVPAGRRLGVPELAVVVIGMAIAASILSPELIRNVSRFRLGSIELELREINQGQRDQQQQLRDVRLFMMLLLSERERQFLKELSEGSPAVHAGSDELRAQLRRLRSVGLIRRSGPRYIRELVDGQRHDIRSVVELTDDGRRYVQQTAEPVPTTAPPDQG
jgi:hypothetical protein